MISLLHGSNTPALKKALDFYKTGNGGKEILTINAKTEEPEIITESLATNSLFSGNRTIIIENLFSTKTALLKEIPALLKNTPHDVIFVEEKEIDKKSLASLPPNTKITYFKPIPLVFHFLDSLGGNSTKETLLLLSSLCQKERPEIVLFHLVKRFRTLIALESSKNHISELKKLADWQTLRLKNQKTSLGLEKLKSVYRKLLEIEIKEKTGRAIIPLDAAIEFFILQEMNANE